MRRANPAWLSHISAKTHKQNFIFILGLLLPHIFFTFSHFYSILFYLCWKSPRAAGCQIPEAAQPVCCGRAHAQELWGSRQLRGKGRDVRQVGQTVRQSSLTKDQLKHQWSVLSIYSNHSWKSAVCVGLSAVHTCWLRAARTAWLLPGDCVGHISHALH